VKAGPSIITTRALKIFAVRTFLFCSYQAYLTTTEAFTMAAVNIVSKNTELARKMTALLININAAKGLQNVLSSNLGPRGTMKM